MTLVACIGGGQLGRMLGLAGLPLGLSLPVPRPRGRRLRGRRGRARRRRVRRSRRARAPGGRRGRRHLRVRERAGRVGCGRRRRARGRRARAGAGPPAREGALPLAGIPTARFGDLETTGVPALVKTRRLGYDGKGQRRAEEIEPLAEGELAEELVPFDRELSIVGVRGRGRRDALLAGRRERPSRRDPPRHPRTRGGRAAGGGGGDLHDAPRRARLRRRPRGRAVRGRRPAARERVRPAGPQHRALDDRRRSHEPVRKPSAGDPRPPARRDGGAGPIRHGEPHRRRAAARGACRAPRRARPPLREGSRAPGARSGTSRSSTRTRRRSSGRSRSRRRSQPASGARSVRRRACGCAR